VSDRARSSLIDKLWNSLRRECAAGEPVVFAPEVVGAVLLAEAAPGHQADAGLLQQPHAVEHVGGLVVLLQEEHPEDQRY